MISAFFILNKRYKKKLQENAKVVTKKKRALSNQKMPKLTL